MNARAHEARAWANRGKSMLERLAHWTYAHRWKTLIIWIVALFAFLFLGSALKGPYGKSFSLPGTGSQTVQDILKSRIPSRAGGTAEIVFKADAGVNDPTIKTKMQTLFGQVGALPGMQAVVSPYDPAGARQISRNGTIAFADFHFKAQAVDVPKAEADKIITLGNAVKAPGLQVEYSGDVIFVSQQQAPGGAEAIGLLAAILILFFTFGSLLAMGLPLLSAIFGIAIGLSLVLLFANVISVPEFTPEIAAMIGIGVGIDYALFMVTRYRQGLQ